MNFMMKRFGKKDFKLFFTAIESDIKDGWIDGKNGQWKFELDKIKYTEQHQTVPGLTMVYTLDGDTSSFSRSMSFSKTNK